MKARILSFLLRELADKLDAGNTNATEDELLELCDQLSFVMNSESKLSKYQAAKLLGVNHKTFDYYVSKGYIPKGMEQQGFKEKFWYRRDIMRYKEEKDTRKN